mgnify:CR=1 FL=1
MLQRKMSKKYLINKKGDSYCNTSNIVKEEKIMKADRFSAGSNDVHAVEQGRKSKVLYSFCRLL